MNSTLSRLFVLVVVLCLVLPVCAEEDDKKSWSNSTTLGLVSTSGNSETTNFALANLFEEAWNKSKLEIVFSALRNETTTRVLTNTAGTVVETSVTDLSAEKYTFGAKYNRVIHERLNWYAMIGWYRDEFAGIQNSSQGGGGLGYLFFKNDQHALRSEFGFSYVEEERLDGSNETFPEARLFLGYDRTLSESSKLNTNLEVLENLDDSSDLRINALIGASANLNKRVALSVSYEIRYDAVPVTITVAGTPLNPGDPIPPNADFEFDEIDTTMKAALVFNF